MELTFQCKVQYLNDLDPFDHRASVPEPLRPLTYVFLANVPLLNQIGGVKRHLQAPHQLEDCALQICKFIGGQLEFSSYLDLDTTLDDQQEELEEFKTNKRNVIILRTQLSVRVQVCLEKLLTSQPKELKKHLFSLKQIFQDDKDLVHEFVFNQGLDCLIKISQQAEPNFINSVLKALGQLMLYVDGMNGVISHNKTIHWLYSLINSQSRLVVKMSLKLLLVFVEYNDSNWQLLTQAINAVDSTSGNGSWSTLMRLLHDSDIVDAELLIYAMTLVNKVLSAVPDQDTFYDITDFLEEQGLESIMKNYREPRNENKDLLEQFSVYDSLVSLEDGDTGPQVFLPGFQKISKSRSSEDMKRKRRKSEDVLGHTASSRLHRPELNLSTSPNISNGFHSEEMLKSSQFLPKLHVEEYIDNNNLKSNDSNNKVTRLTNSSTASDESNRGDNNDDDDDDDSSTKAEESSNKLSHLSVSLSSLPTLNQQATRQSMNRRQRRQRQQSQIKEMTLQPEDALGIATRHEVEDSEYKNKVELTVEDDKKRKIDNSIDKILHNSSNLIDKNELRHENDINMTQDFIGKSKDANHVSEDKTPYENCDLFGNHTTQSINKGIDLTMAETTEKSPSDNDNSISKPSKNIHETDSMPNQSTENNSVDENDRRNVFKMAKNFSLDETQQSNVAIGDDLTSIVCAAKNNLKCTKMPLKKYDSGPPSTNSVLAKFCGALSKPYLNLGTSKLALSRAGEGRQDAIQWSEIEKECTNLPLRVKDVDFTDLTELDDQDYLTDNIPKHTSFNGSSVDPSPIPNPPLPPPPPPLMPQQSTGTMHPPPPPLASTYTDIPAPPPPPLPPGTLKSGTTLKKKTKLHWREAHSRFSTPKGKVIGTVWEEVKKEVGDVRIDKVKFEALFEIKTQDGKAKKSDTGRKELSILDQKRSNAINIGMVHLPKPSAIKNAILSMDNSVLSREDIEKILVGMMPTEEEKSKIIEIQRSNNPNDLQLGTAEQFLLTMGSISELESRLRLWIFKLDYDTIESEICDPLFDLKKGVEELKRSKTFKFILSSLLSIGNFLNNSQVSGFTVDYLVRVIDVKDNVYRHTLLHHLVNIILDTFPNSSDLYSEIGCIIRCAKIDWEDLKDKLLKLETDCISCYEHLRSIMKHDTNFQTKYRMNETLNSIAKRIVLVKIVYRRVLNRFKKFLLWLGYSTDEARTVTVGQLCQAVGEFALEYRTTREKVLNIRLKKANMKERKKTRGVMIVQAEKFANKAKTRKLATVGEDPCGDDLEMLLQNGSSLNPSIKNRTRRSLDPKALQKSLSKPSSSDVESGGSGAGKSDNEGDPSKEGSANKDSERGAVTPTPSEGPEDDFLDAVLKTVTSTNEPRTRERRRARNADRKSLRRTLKSGLTLEEAAVVGNFS